MSGAIFNRALFALIGVIANFLLGNFPSYFELYKSWVTEPLNVSIASWTTERTFYRAINNYEIPIETGVYVSVTNNGQRPISIRHTLSA